MLSVLIGTYNRKDQLQACLDALLGKVPAETEIIVIDAGSTDGTLDFLKNLPGIRLVADGRPIGQAQSLNRVAKNVKTKYLCWLSDDDVVLPGMLKAAVDILEDNSDIGLIGLKTKDVTGPQTNLPYIGGIWPSGILNCNQGVIKTDLFHAVEGFDESLRDYGIDADLTTKVLLAGYKVAFTKEVAIHHYRDHETPSWIDSESRELRLRSGLERYIDKYSSLIEAQGLYNERPKTTIGWLSLQSIKVVYRSLARLGISLEKWVGYAERDWYNIMCGRFISLSDLIENRGRPFYLLQQLPDSALNRSPVNVGEEESNTLVG